MTRLKCSDTGESINLGKEISKSGEGRIYQTSKAGFLAKIYHTITQEQIDKLQVMVKNPPIDPTRSQGHVSIAWPKCLLQDSYGKSLGFLMEAIGNGQTLINVYNPARRKKKAAGFNWFYLHTTAMNIASIVGAIHNNNYVVGDLKPDNLLVTPNAYVSIIDTDSFQILDRQTRKIYRCPVASQEYTPREMFGKDLQKVDRSDFQDGFALGVIIWQLLFGYHPFSGQWSGSGNPPNIDQLIEQGLWMYGSSSKLRPGQLSMPINIIHPELRKLFYKCFNDGHSKPNARPSAADWETALRQAISELTGCSVESGHHHAKSYGKCYWCERKRQLNGYDMFASPSATPKPTVSSVTNKNPIRQQVQPRKPVVIPVKPSPVTSQSTSNDPPGCLIGVGSILVMLILSCFAFPAFLTHANKAKQSEAKPNSSPKEEVRSQTTSSTPSDSTERVSFNKGSTGATISNSVTTNQKKRYLLNCGRGERMTVQIRQGGINIAIIAPNDQTIGNVIKAGTQWQGQLPSEGDYIIEVSAPNQSDYTINIEVLPSKKTPVSSTPATNTPVSSTPEQTLKSFYELTTKDNKAAGKKFTTDNFRNKYRSTDADNQETFVSNFNSIEIIDSPKPTKESSPTRPIMTVFLRYSPKDSREQVCEYRDFAFVLNNNYYLIDDEIGQPTQASCP
ncbi:helix-hairpin-helix domain-containing protein [Microcoleus anatoxicus]|uniref:Protein kinase domain-containing protein n=1 Tax=Microcoleus anatoxicus PTRS2 TaxID=2705321 RepID=A0ABU8YNU4_9CYAN